MIRFATQILAGAAALAAFALPTLAKAGGCCECYGGCGGPAVTVLEPSDATTYVAPPFYLVNRGPVFTGPGHYVQQYPDVPLPEGFPPVGPYYNAYDGGPVPYDPYIYAQSRYLYSPLRLHVSSGPRIIEVVRYRRYRRR